ncbi:hypothetical protein SLA2020_437820 [Shorea laevis]
MADLASAITTKILEKLGSLTYGEFSLVFNIKSELSELEDTMSTIKDVLSDAEEKQGSNRALSRWLTRLKDICYEADDVLEEVECEDLRQQVVRTNGCTSREVRDFFPCCTALAFHSQLGHKIKDIREKLGKIAADKDQFNLTSRLEDRHVMPGRRDMTHSFVPPSDVIGRNDDKENIINLLKQPDANRNVSVIPIVGLGGLGKTTIAKLIYDENRVVDHFELRMWVCVSEDFDVPRLIIEILKESRFEIDERLCTPNELQRNLRERLQNKKFLLVLDDVWNEDRSKWIELIGLLSGGPVGSRIVVTTRSHLVASIVGTCPKYTLGGLSLDYCLSLFVKWAFKEGEDKQYPNLVEIGKEIVEKCKGVPLAIRTLGSLLFSKVDELQYWKFVRDNEIWKLEQKESDILPALKLTYNQMSSHLKQCFAFCSLFPKDYLFYSFELIAFWMAHGLLSYKMPNSQNLDLEDIGNMYIKDLLSRSFFQDVENFLWYYRFKMHDLVHDLALKVAEDECAAINFHTKNIAGTVRHLSFFHNGHEVPKYFYALSSGVRTTLFPSKVQVSTLVEACILRFKYLRVLNLSESSFEVLSSSIGTLKHLRYLSLAENDRIKKLPDSIYKLHNLQTLLLHGCSRLEWFLKDTKKMISLRDGREPYQPSDIGCERNCEVLSLTRREDNRDLKLSLQKLKIEHLPKLQVLPQWLQGSASNLQFLSIEDCGNFMALPDWLPSLTSLHTLEIINCSKLSSLPEGMDRLTALKELTIKDCPDLIRKCKEEDQSKMIAHIPTVRLVD